MSTLKVNTVQHNTSGFNNVVLFTDGAGTQNGALCRAWVNFNGTGTVAIRASFNISSIVDNTTGDYTVNFSNAMPDANYSCIISGNLSGGDDGNGRIGNGLHSSGTVASGSFRIRCIWAGDGNTLEDKQVLTCAVFR